jgi:hypothetical protein
MFTGNEDHRIAMSVAKVMTKRYRESIEDGDRIGGFFGGSNLRDLLAQTGCVGMRYYYGIDSTGNKVLILIGTNADGDDLTQGLILDASIPCPNQCTVNDLTSS